MVIVFYKSFFRTVVNRYQAFRVLRIKPNSSIQEIKSAYRTLVLEFHPDKNEKGDTRFKKVTQAYNLLKEPVKKVEKIIKEKTPDQVKFEEIMFRRYTQKKNTKDELNQSKLAHKIRYVSQINGEITKEYEKIGNLDTLIDKLESKKREKNVHPIVNNLLSDKTLKDDHNK